MDRFDTGLMQGRVYAMDGVAPDDVWAVGRTEALSLAAHWDGSSWEVVPVPPVGAMRNPLLGVSALAPDDVWAVGYWSDTFGQWVPLAAHWDGTAWEAMSVPTHDIQISRLRDVVALAPDDVWAVGDYYDLEDATQPLIVHWDGASWTPLELPMIPGGPAELRGVAAVSADEVYGAGTQEPPGEEMTALLMRFDGQEWSIIDEPEVPGSHEWFRGMGTIPGGVVWAVGQYYSGARSTSTLTERLATDCCAPDFDGDGSVDTRDVLSFLNAWSAGDPRSDFNRDGLIDAQDVLAFLNSWNVGC